MPDLYLLEKKITRKKTLLNRLKSFKKILFGLAENKDKKSAEKELFKELNK